MPDFQQRDGFGQLFRNDKAESDKHPSHKGTFLLDGVTYEIAAWVKEGKRGRFFSLKVQPQGERPQRQEPAQASGGYQSKRRTPGEYPEPQAGRGGSRKPVQDDAIPF